MLQEPSCRGTCANGRLSGTFSFLTELYIKAACANKSSVTTRAGMEVRNLGNVSLRCTLGILQRIDTVDAPMECDQHRQRDHEDDPAFEAMEESPRQLWIDFA